MHPTLTTVVWFKRDLRIRDHEPLTIAATDGAVLPLYIHEHAITGAADFAPQHAGFIRECLDSLQAAISLRGVPLIQQVGNAVDVLESLWRKVPFTVLRSHEETGHWISYERDKAVAAWCRQRSVHWIQTPQNGVIRGTCQARAARNWGREMQEYTSSDPVRPPERITPPTGLETILSIAPPEMTATDAADLKLGRMRGGREKAMRLLRQFFGTRILNYPSSVSSPLTAEHGCSRLSPYLTFGVVSVREVILTMNRRLQQPDMANEGFARERMIKAMRFFVDRIEWRSGYFQNMESTPSLEFQSLNASMDGLRESEFDQVRFDAWCKGETGYPMVDACMKMLLHAGWINMRMRGMLISFAVNELWLHWREPGLFLARQFLDYEPAIHYNQLQIHAGTAGATQLLSYNPVKQAQDLDTEGKFVRRWIPAMARVPDAFLFEPWTMPESMQRQHRFELGIDYPSPIVDYVVAGRAARERVSAAQKGRAAPAQAKQKGLF